MRLLEKYITQTIVSIFLATVLIFAGLFVLFDSTGHLDEFIDRQVPLDIIVQYYLYSLPDVLSQTASVALLIASLLTYSILGNHNEIIVMRSSGLNFWKIVKPALILSLLLSVVVFWVNEKFVPYATEQQKQIENQHMILEVDRERKKDKKINNLTFYGLKNRLYYIDSFSTKDETLDGITILEYDNKQNLRQKILALNGKWTGIAWKFYRVQITTYGEQGVRKPKKIRVYGEKLMDIQETPEDFIRQRLNVKVMNVRELGGYITRFSDSGARKALNKLRVDYHQKISFPFASFVIVLLGLPFSLMMHNRKGTTFASLGLAVAIGFLYYVANAVALAFGKAGVLPPMLAAWTAPILFTGIGLLVIEFDFAN